jgi:hypothetical protein
MSTDSGSTLLTEAPAEGGGNPGATNVPEGTETQGTQSNGADEALSQVQNGPPEYIPAKFWDPDTKTVRTEDLGKGYMNLEKMLGREKVPVPTSEDDKEGWERWYAAMGRPEAPDKYEFERPELPTDLPYDEEMEKEFREWAHINGLSKRQAQSFYEGYVKRQIARHTDWSNQAKETRQQAEAALRREYGRNYDQAIQQAKAAMMTYADPDFHRYLDESGAGNDPRMIRIFARIGKELRGDTRLQGRTEAANPADAQKAIAEFRTKHNDALYNRDHPEHKQRVSEMQQLFERAFPDAPTL